MSQTADRKPTVSSDISRGRQWLSALTANAASQPGYPASVQVVDATLDGRQARYLAVVPDPDNRFPRATHGEVGLAEGWALARAVRETMALDQSTDDKRAIVAVIDVPSQAYGRTEEAYGIHQALAAAAQAYATARQHGHAVLGLIVGKAMSGGFLAHGYQADRLIALSGEEVLVHAMGKQAAARITQRSVEGVEKLARTITPMAYDIDSYEKLGLLYRRLDITSGQSTDDHAVSTVVQALAAAWQDIKAPRDLSCRLDRHSNAQSRGQGRQASTEVRRRLRAQWAG